MILVDTGYFIALATQRDQLHSRAHAWSRRIRSSLVVTEYVLLETVNHLSSPDDRRRAAALAQRVRAGGGYEFVPATPRWLNAGLRLHGQRPDKHWSLTDCISFEVMRDRGITSALAYDEHFVQAGFEALLRREPK